MFIDKRDCPSFLKQRSCGTKWRRYLRGTVARSPYVSTFSSVLHFDGYLKSYSPECWPLFDNPFNWIVFWVGKASKGKEWGEGRKWTMRNKVVPPRLSFWRGQRNTIYEQDCLSIKGRPPPNTKHRHAFMLRP